jgi:hypothetical protein
MNFTHLLLKLEAGNAVDHQAAGAVMAVIDRDLEPHPAQTVGGGQACGTGADDADALRDFRGGTNRFDPALLECGVSKVFFDRANGDCAVA